MIFSTTFKEFLKPKSAYQKEYEGTRNKPKYIYERVMIKFPRF